MRTAIFPLRLRDRILEDLAKFAETSSPSEVQELLHLRLKNK